MRDLLFFPLMIKTHNHFQNVMFVFTLTTFYRSRFPANGFPLMPTECRQLKTCTEYSLHLWSQSCITTDHLKEGNKNPMADKKKQSESSAVNSGCTGCCAGGQGSPCSNGHNAPLHCHRQQLHEAPLLHQKDTFPLRQKGNNFLSKPPSPIKLQPLLSIPC